MRTYDEYRQILELWELGIPKKRIALTLSIPRATVKDCIERYGNLKRLEENKERASRSTSTEVLGSIQNVSNIHVRKSYAYLFGLYLGDGYIVRNKRIYFLRISLDARYPNIIQHCYDAIQTILPDNRAYIFNSKQGNWVEVLGYYKFWPDLFPQHGVGMKHKREIKLADWQQNLIEAHPLKFFRGLYHSDGSRYSNVVNGKDYPRYQFSNSSEDIRKLFCQTSDLLGLQWTGNPGKRLVCKEVFISKRKDVEYLDRVVGPKS